VDEFFSKIESQKLDIKLLQQVAHLCLIPFSRSIFAYAVFVITAFHPLNMHLHGNAVHQKAYFHIPPATLFILHAQQLAVAVPIRS
jgi:ABC-type uncharacterized transport system permease subunit